MASKAPGRISPRNDRHELKLAVAPAVHVFVLPGDNK
jgi:hypothetical protein